MNKIKLPKSPSDLQRSRRVNNNSFTDLSSQLTKVVSDLNTILSSKKIEDNDSSKTFTSNEVNNLINISNHESILKIQDLEKQEIKFRDIISKLEMDITELKKELQIKDGVIEVLKNIQLNTSVIYTDIPSNSRNQKTTMERPKIESGVVIDPTPIDSLESHVNINSIDHSIDKELDKDVINDKVNKLKHILGNK